MFFWIKPSLQIQIETGKQHKVVPVTFKYVVDVCSTEDYTNHEILEVIENNTVSAINARSIRFNPSFIPEEHPIVKLRIEIRKKNLWLTNTLISSFYYSINFKIGHW